MMDKPLHGTRERYGRPHHCRCELCRAAAARYSREWRYRSQAAGVPEGATHGRISTYANWGCRCEPCRAAMAAYHQTRKARRQNVSPAAYAHVATDTHPRPTRT